MKIRTILLFPAVLSALGLAVLASQSTHAEIIITPEQTTAIKTHCVENQAVLNQLHQTDAFLRIDRGNLYRTISDKLMVPLNRRLAANRLDGGSLTNITADFNREYNRFYKAYISYDNAITKLLGIDCTKEPVAFYNALLEARVSRAVLNSSNQRLVQLARDYKVEFDTFRTQFLREQVDS